MRGIWIFDCTDCGKSFIVTALVGVKCSYCESKNIEKQGLVTAETLRLFLDELADKQTLEPIMEKL